MWAADGAGQAAPRWRSHGQGRLTGQTAAGEGWIGRRGGRGMGGEERVVGHRDERQGEEGESEDCERDDSR